VGQAIVRCRLPLCRTGKKGRPPKTTLDVADKNQVFESPLVDSASGTVFVFSNGSPSATYNAFAGTFDINYLNSPSTGLIYACGTNSQNAPQLYAVTETFVNTGAAAHGPLALSTDQTFLLSADGGLQSIH
jgi:hypothetical protein